MISLSTSSSSLADANIGTYTKKFANSDLLIEAHLIVSGYNGLVPHAILHFGNTQVQVQYISQIIPGPLTTLNFIAHIATNTIITAQALSMSFKTKSFSVLCPNESHCPGSGCGQTVSIFKITEIPK